MTGRFNKFYKTCMLLKQEGYTPVAHCTGGDRTIHQQEALSSQSGNCSLNIIHLIAKVIRSHTNSRQGACHRALVIERLQQFQPWCALLVQKTHAHVLQRVLDNVCRMIAHCRIEGLALHDVAAGDTDVVENELGLHQCQCQ